MSSIALYDTSRNSLTNLIGWLSLSLLAAGWGAEFDTSIRNLWANIGLFGLASMIGLKVVHMSKVKAQKLATESRVEHDVKRISNGKDSGVLLKEEAERLAQAEQVAAAQANQIEMEMIAHSTDEELVSLLSHCIPLINERNSRV
ncbi:hypothetical protein [Gimesia sp.]|uniref:hypothetical protein n=1 Tax=Gimesia sp. TaxID=2024833 RepID=UPI003A93C92A